MKEFFKIIIANVKDVKTTIVGIILVLLAIALITHAITGTELITIITALSGMGFVFGARSDTPAGSPQQNETPRQEE